MLFFIISKLDLFSSKFYFICNNPILNSIFVEIRFYFFIMYTTINYICKQNLKKEN